MDTTTKTPKACIGDMFPSVFPGMPMFAYVPNPYDCGRPAKVYPGDNTYYCVKGAPLCAVDAEDAALLAIRRTVCRTMNQCYAVEVCKGWEAAAAVITNYLEGRYKPQFQCE